MRTKQQILNSAKEFMTERELDILDSSIMEVDINIKFESVILSDGNKAKFKRFINEQSYRDKLRALNLRPVNRILMYGASGTGKTYSTKALANLLDKTLLYIDIAQALESNDVAKNISVVFKYANYTKDCIIMLDEADALAWNRESLAGGEEQTKARRGTNSVFQQLDQMHPDNIFISATNMQTKLDPAFVRRFDIEMIFERPKLNIRDCIIKFLNKDAFELIDDADKDNVLVVEKRLARLQKLSYYGLQVIVEENMKEAVIDETYKVHTEKIYSDLAVYAGIGSLNSSKTSIESMSGIIERMEKK